MKDSIIFYFFSPIFHLPSFIGGLLTGHLVRNHSLNKHLNWLTSIGIASSASFLIAIVNAENLNILNGQLAWWRILGMMWFGHGALISFFCWIIAACSTCHFRKTQANGSFLNSNLFFWNSYHKTLPQFHRLPATGQAELWILPVQHRGHLLSTLLAQTERHPLRTVHGKSSTTMMKESRFQLFSLPLP